MHSRDKSSGREKGTRSRAEVSNASEPFVHKFTSRQEYVKAQVERSHRKFGYCKVFISDVIRYRDFILQHVDRSARVEMGPILCLGVRSGAEIDLFRAVFFGRLLHLRSMQRLASSLDNAEFAPKKIVLSKVFGIASGRMDDSRVVGVEINPDCRRPDVVNTSFDELPEDWSGRFRIMFSNSFDHSYDPKRTVREWRRVAAPGCYVILAYDTRTNVTPDDPVGGLSLHVLCNVWKSEPVFHSETANRTGYHEVIFRL